MNRARHSLVRSCACGMIMSGFVVSSPTLAQPQYEIVDIHYADTASYAFAISDDGWIVGNYSWQGWISNALVWHSDDAQDAVDFCFEPCQSHYSRPRGINNVGFAVGDDEGAADLIDLATLAQTPIRPDTPSGHSKTYPEDVNDDLVVVGRYRDSGDSTHRAGFRWTPGGGFEPLLPPAAFYPHPLAINNVGETVGTYELSTGEVIAFIHDDQDGVQDLNDRLPPDSPWHLEVANDINEAGEIVGVGALNGVPERAFLLQGSVVIDLGGYLPHGSEAVAINNPGEALIAYRDREDSILFTPDGTFHDLNALIVTPGDWDVDRVTDLNNNGQIIGVIYVDPGYAHAVCLTPVTCPEDLDGDGTVGQADLGILLSAYGSTDEGDIDGDGDTDQADLGALLGKYGEDC
jgi:uncharacterized membrane protein